MIRIRTQHGYFRRCGVRPDGTSYLEHVLTGLDTAWASDLDRGLCVQKSHAGRFFGVTHLASGLKVVETCYRYSEALALQNLLLALPLDWTASRQALNSPEMTAIIRPIVLAWLAQPRQ